MSSFRLVCQRGRHVQDEWSLSPGRAVLVGRRDGAVHVPDIDLTFDRQVSRQHARIWFENEAWWLQDLGSAHGTRVGRRALAPRESVRLEPGADIQLGRTALTLFPPHWHQLRGADIVVEIAVSRAIDAVLAQTGTQILTRLIVRNPTGLPGGARELTFAIQDEGSGIATVPPLSPGESRSLQAPRFAFRGTRRAATKRRWQPLSVALDGKLLQCSQPMGAWFLASDEWSLLAEHRSHLAGFVMPTHPAVTAAVQEATTGLSQRARGEAMLGCFHDYLASVWHLDYRLEPVGSPAAGDEPLVQRIRLPDGVLANHTKKVGSGTCLDLALLIAALIEASHRQPLIAIVDRGESRHALVGCWQRARRGLQPVLMDRESLLAEAIWLDPNGCTRDRDYRVAFETAQSRAADDLRNRLAFAVDVSAARRDGVLPLLG